MRLLLASLLFAAAAGCAGHATVVAEPAPPPPAPAPAPRAAPPPVVVVETSPAQHPAYLHALTDLRHARALLERPAKPDVKWDENAAIREIDAAINEIKQAAIDDRKPLEDHPPIDAHVNHRDRLRQAQQLLHKAAGDIDEKEDNNWAKGLRGRANMHIRNAENAVNAAIGDRAAGTPPPPPVVVEAPPAQAHPAYLHALTDLRYARFLLEKPAKPEVKWDESNAVREIDAAINEIKQASIDDNKPLEDHPPVDAKLKHRGRLKQAEELLHKAAADIDEKEQNDTVKGLRGRANGHIHNAEHAVHEAMNDRGH
jgi:hypothetical protein